MKGLSNRSILLMLGSSIFAYDLLCRMLLQLEALGDFSSMRYVALLSGITWTLALALISAFFLYARVLNSLPSSASTQIKTKGYEKVVRQNV